MAGIQADDRQTEAAQAQPGRELPGFQAEAHRERRPLPHDPGNRLRVGGAPAAPDDLAGAAEDTDGSLFQGDVEANLLFHGSFSGSVSA
jgi:hypothetical protein